jgi:hypothetical protein
MQLVLNSKTISQAWSSAGEFWFSRVDYSVHNNTDLDGADEAKLVSSGFLPFVTVCDEEVMRAYINSLGNKKISKTFSTISSEEYVETFWKYFNVYPQVSEGYQNFETQYVLNKIATWCDENSIEYKIEK